MFTMQCILPEEGKNVEFDRFDASIKICILSLICKDIRHNYLCDLTTFAAIFMEQAFIIETEN